VPSQKQKLEVALYLPIHISTKFFNKNVLRVWINQHVTYNV
jgi:hypothetical protein